MFKQGDSSSRQKNDGCFSQQVYGKMWDDFFLNTEKRFLVEVLR